LYHIYSRDICKKVQKRIKTRCSHTIDNDSGGGYAVGYWYVAVISDKRHYDTEIWLVATEDTYKRLVEHDTLTVEVCPQNTPTPHQDNTHSEQQHKETNQEITIHTRIGSFSNCYFYKRNINLHKLAPLSHQSGIVERILSHHEQMGHTVAYLHGPPGSGKSIVGLLLSKKLQAHYCNTLKPWQAGDSLAELYADVEPSAEKHLVLVFDEIDNALVKIHAGIHAHKDIPTSTPDKAGWNIMLDEIQAYPYDGLHDVP